MFKRGLLYLFVLLFSFSVVSATVTFENLSPADGATEVSVTPTLSFDLVTNSSSVNISSLSVLVDFSIFTFPGSDDEYYITDLCTFDSLIDGRDGFHVECSGFSLNRGDYVVIYKDKDWDVVWGRDFEKEFEEG